MRTHLLSLACAVLAATSCCAAPDTYTLTGTIAGAADGDTVRLQRLEGEELITEATTTVSHGAYSFQGEATPPPHMRYINHADRYVDLFIESGHITADIAADGEHTGGTPTNVAHELIRWQLNAIAKGIDSCYTALRDKALTPDARTGLEQLLDRREKSYYQAIRDHAKANIRNGSGIFLFKEMHKFFSMEELDSLARLVPEEFLAADSRLRALRDKAVNYSATASGQRFTDVALSTPDGAPARISDWAGKGHVVLLDFWASWCGPCRGEMPNVVRAYARYHSKGFEIVGLSLDEDAGAWRNAIKTLGMTWPQLSDLKGWRSAAAQAYAVKGIPHTVLIDAKGNIIARGLRGETLTQKLAEIYGE